MLIRLKNLMVRNLVRVKLRNLVIGEIPPIFLTFDSIRRTNFHDVITREESKTCKLVYAKRRFINLHKSYPYGYKTP